MDEKFRKVMRQVIDSSKNEILVITGEAGAFKHYYDLRWAIERAIVRGVKVRVYAKSPEQTTINQLIDHGCEVYLGEDVPKDHYTIIDKNTWVESLEHEPKKVGVRFGSMHIGDQKGAKKLCVLFNNLISKAKKAHYDKNADPIFKILKNPLYLSFNTDSNKINLGLL